MGEAPSHSGSAVECCVRAMLLQHDATAVLWCVAVVGLCHLSNAGTDGKEKTVKAEGLLFYCLHMRFQARISPILNENCLPRMF